MTFNFKVKKVPLRPLMPQQIKFHEWAKPRINPACFMEMRLGKTLATIRWIVSLPLDPFCRDEATDSFPCLVVAPMSVIESWQKELDLECENYTVIHGKTFQQRVDLAVQSFAKKGRSWVLINYESLRATPGLVSLPWFVVVLDESTVIKNPQSQISKLCTSTSAFQDVIHRIILSGLPAPEGELDLYQQFKFLHASFMGCKNYWEYRSRYFELKWDGWQPKSGVKTQIKSLVHDKAFVLTRQQANIGSKKIKENRHIRMTADQLKVYDRIENEFVAEVKSPEWVTEIETDHVVVQRSWLARVAGGHDVRGNFKWPAKANELVYLLKNDLATESVVVCFRFTDEIHSVASVLKKAGIQHQTLTGADSREERKRKQEWFRSTKTVPRVMLLQIKKVASHGVDMSTADTMIFYSVTYSCEEMAQIEERIVHPQKKQPLLYIFLVTEDTIDEDAVFAVRSKVTSSKLFMSKFKGSFLSRMEGKK